MNAPKNWRSQYRRLTADRLKAEAAILAKTYPHFRLAWHKGRWLFRGALRSNQGSEFIVEIRLPFRYPEAEPHLWIVSPALPKGTGHIYKDGRICAHAEPFIPYRTTAATMISVLAGWIHRFERHRLEGTSWKVPLTSPSHCIHIRPDGQLEIIKRKPSNSKAGKRGQHAHRRRRNARTR